MNGKPTHIFPMLLAIVIALTGVVSSVPARAYAAPASGGLVILPGFHNFGDMEVGFSTDAKPFTLWNYSAYSVRVYDVKILPSLDPGGPWYYDFDIWDNACWDVEWLPVNGYCVISIVFSPRSTGSKTAYLHIWADYSDPPGGDPHTDAMLTGNGKLQSEVTQSGAKNAGETGDPVTTSVGEYHFGKPLLNLGGPLPLQFTLYYASWMIMGKTGGHNDPFGWNWDHNHHFALTYGGADSITIQYGPGDRIQFQKSGSVWQVMNEETIYQLKEDDTGPGHYYLLGPLLERIYTFEKKFAGALGILTRIEDRNGNALTFTNDDMGHILQIEDGLGRSLVFTYSPPEQRWYKPQLTQVTDQTGRTIRFGYQDPQGGNLHTRQAKAPSDARTC